MKRVAALILSLLLVSGCAGQGRPQPAELTPPFWEVHDETTGGTLYLLGSMHVGRDDAYYPDYVLQAFAESTTVAAEVDTEADDSVVLKGMEYLQCADGTDAQDHFGEDYAKTADFFESKDLYLPQLDGYIPYFWCSYLSTSVAEECGLYSEYGSESYFISRAHLEGKAFVEIESYEEQYRMMSELPMPIQVYAVTSAIGEEQYAEQCEDTLALYEAWSKFDESALEELNTTLYDDVPSDLSDEYAVFVDKMYISRQRKMADVAAELLKSGETSFMLVGAAHFYIEDDILTLLEAEGHTVTAVYPESVSQAA